jgi:aminoglycoside phosphotransferase (APT) family kinase protein
VSDREDHFRFVESRLAELAPALGGTAVSNLRQLTGGASKETWAFDLEQADARVPLILRRLPPHSAQHEIQMALATEAAVISAAREAGVKVPAVRYLLQAGDRLGEGFVMERVEGETIPRKIIRDAEFDLVRPKLAYQFGRELARIHRFEGSLPGMRLAPGSTVLAGLARDLERGSTPRPVFAFALRWLAKNLPADPPRPRLVHGDFRNGNIIFGPAGIEAVLDWELAHFGDPMEDLGWLFMTPWRFGQIDLPAGGVGTREQVFQGYADGGGTVEVGRIRFWEIAGSLRWGMNCDYALSRLELQGSAPDIEQAMIARRVSETEIDLLRMIHLEE